APPVEAAPIAGERAAPAVQLAVGNYNLLINVGDVRDGVVNIAVPDQAPRPKLRPLPVLLRPRPFSGLLDRQVEVAQATASLLSRASTEFCGEPGIGKTTLLVYLAHHPTADVFRDGVVMLAARARSSQDLAAALYHAFYTSEIPFHPTAAQLQPALQERRALVLLDDVDLSREALETLLHMMPASTFVITSQERRLWGSGTFLSLAGLPVEAGVALLIRELGHVLAADETPVAEALVKTVEGHPLRVLQLASLVRVQGASLTELAQGGERTALTSRFLTQVGALDATERRGLAALAALGGGPAPVTLLHAMTAAPDLSRTLRDLTERVLAQAHSPAFSLPEDVRAALAVQWDLDAWRARGLEVLPRWAAENTGEIPGAWPVIESLLAWGAENDHAGPVLASIRMIEAALAGAGQWDAWRAVLQLGLRAARALGDRAGEAWLLHQLGTRALCLAEVVNARTLLVRALELREALGDRAGAAITRHNLDLLMFPPPPPEEPEPPSEPEPQPEPELSPQVAKPSAPLTQILFKRFATAVLTFCAVAVVVVGALVGLNAVRDGWDQPTELLLGPSRTPTTESPEPSSTPTPIPPIEVNAQVSIALLDGCDRDYAVGDSTRLEVSANVAGVADVQLDGAYWGGRELVANETWTTALRFDDLEPDSHQFSVALRCDGDVIARDTCDFEITREATPLPPPTLRAPKQDAVLACAAEVESVGVSFAWSRVSGDVASYAVVVEALESQPQVYPTYQIASTSWQTALPCNEVFRWRVQALGSAGAAGEWSGYSRFSTSWEVDLQAPPAPQPEGPGSATVEESESVTCPALLTWAPVEDSSGVYYQVQLERAMLPEAGFEVWDTSAWIMDTTLEIVYPDCESGLWYRWRVTARDGAGNWNESWSAWLYYGVPIE
ncbi:MAG: ATP-binding protein, partial [Anaerolineae bacterium]|nr:ATP-binding protein [Anaerolineae bacterium]